MRAAHHIHAYRMHFYVSLIRGSTGDELIQQFSFAVCSYQLYNVAIKYYSSRVQQVLQVVHRIHAYRVHFTPH